MKKCLFVYGTRPEAIKMAPLISELRRRPEDFQVEVCLTGQHRQMLDQVNSFFKINGDYDLDLMQPNQTLFDITAKCLKGLERVLDDSEPDCVIVQGDTTTVLAGSLAAFYKKIPVVHLEAGLRSGDAYSPFPEEMNRKIASRIATLHFAPTAGAAKNLEREGIIDGVHIVGNTVIDALIEGLAIIENSGEDYRSNFPGIDFAKRIVLVTGHRRESFGDGFENICNAIKDIAGENENIQIVYPVHLNPNVREPVNRLLMGVANIALTDPLDYPRMIWMLKRSYIVITDSGGIQEEAPALGKPVLVMRDVTERTEGVEAGTATLVGTSREGIRGAAFKLLNDRAAYDRMAKSANPYGDGKSSERIADILQRQFPSISRYVV